MAPRTAWSSGSVLIVAVFEIGNTKQWKTKRVLCVIYQEISTGIVTYPVVFFFSIFFLSEGKKNGKTILLLFWFNFNLPFCLGNKPNNKRLYETADYVFSSSFLLHLHLKCSSFLFKFAYCIIISSYWISDLKTNEAVSIVDLDVWRLVKVNTHTLKS